MGISGDPKIKECIAIVIFLVAIFARVAFHAPTPAVFYVHGSGDGREDIYRSSADDYMQIKQVFKFVTENPEFLTLHLKGPLTYLLRGDALLIGDDSILEAYSDAGIELIDETKLIDEADWSQLVPLIASQSPYGDDNTIVQGFGDDGNSEVQMLSGSLWVGNGYYNMPSKKSSAIMPYPFANFLFLLFCIGGVLVYPAAGPLFARELSYRDAVKILLLLFVGLCVLFPYLSGIYNPSDLNNTSEPSSNVQIYKENRIVTAKNEEGAVIYNGSDDADAIEAALGEVDSGVIIFQKGEYNIDRTIRLKSDISFVGNEGVVLNCARAPAFNTGTYGYSSSTISLLNDAGSGDTQIELSSVAGLQVGDYIKISDDFSVPYQRSYYKNGELAEIVSIKGSRITIDSPLYDTYTIANNARVRKISMLKNISFENIDFVGYGMGTSSTAIYFYGVKNIKILNCGFADFGTRGISFFDCLDCLVEGNTFKRIFRDGTGYGIAITNACDNVVIKNNSFLEKGRHYIAIVASRGGVTTDGFTRHVDILDNVFRDSADEAVNSHPTSAAVINVIGNEFYNSRKGVEFSNSNSVIKNNTFVGCVNGVVLFDPGNHLVEGNHFKENKISIIPHSTNSVIRDNFFDGDG